MTVNKINSALLLNMIQMGAKNLSNHRDFINKLNVFPEIGRAHV